MVIYALVAFVVAGFLMLYYSNQVITNTALQSQGNVQMGVHIVNALVDHPDGVTQAEMQRIHELLRQSNMRAWELWTATTYIGDEMKLVCNALDAMQRHLVAQASQMQLQAQALDIESREKTQSVFQHMKLWAKVRDTFSDAVLIGLKNDANPIAQLAVATMKADMLNHNRGVITAFQLGEFAIKLAEKFHWQEAEAKANGQLQAYFSLVVNQVGSSLSSPLLICLISASWQAHTCDHVRKMCHIIQEKGGAAFHTEGKTDDELKVVRNGGAKLLCCSQLCLPPTD
jgi:hypothetical protein